MQPDSFTPASFKEAMCSAIKEVVVIEDDRILELMLAALICRGHIFLEDVPGVGKTLLARVFAHLLDLDFKRIQFTPDLLPSDVTGTRVFNQKTNEFQFMSGPVFTNILLADEINRATPRTQASLLECMQENTVTIDGTTYELSSPFMVLATQNPVEMEGTFPLPEAQLDRFFMCLNLGYPGEEGEKTIIRRFLSENTVERDSSSLTAGKETIKNLYHAFEKVYLSTPVLDYILSITRSTRSLEGVQLGVSPRGTLYLARAARALALIRNRDFVLPDDVQDAALPVLAHRLVRDTASSLFEITAPSLIEEVLEDTPVPVGPFQEVNKQ